MKCPRCGKEIADNSKFCEFCGQKVAGGAQAKYWWWVALLLCLLAVVAVILRVVIDEQNSKEDIQDTAVDTVAVASSPQETTRPTTTTRSDDYYVVAGWFRDINNARNYLQKIRDLGYINAFMMDWRSGYRVVAAKLSSRSQAIALARTLEIEVRPLGNKIKPFATRVGENESTYRRGYIYDNDGWSNVRDGQSRNANILMRLDHGTEILYRVTQSGWYEVYDVDTEDFLGYVHRSCIR